MVALILSIVALGISIVALVIVLRKKESHSDFNCNSNEVQMGDNQASIESQSEFNSPQPILESPFSLVGNVYILDGNLEVTGGISCLNKSKEK